jgi:hypothetical protein
MDSVELVMRIGVHIFPKLGPEDVDLMRKVMDSDYDPKAADAVSPRRMVDLLRTLCENLEWRQNETMMHLDQCVQHFQRVSDRLRREPLSSIPIHTNSSSLTLESSDLAVQKEQGLAGRNQPSLTARALKRPSPPMALFVLFLIVLGRRECDVFIGDLEERHGILFEKQGREAATRWFWRQVALSFFSLALEALKRISGLEKLLRRIGS